MADETFEHPDGVVIRNPIELKTLLSCNNKRDNRRSKSWPATLRLIVGTARVTNDLEHPAFGFLCLALAIPSDVHHVLLDVEHEEALYRVLDKRRRKRAASKKRRAKERAIWDAGAPARIAARAARQETVDG